MQILGISGKAETGKDYVCANYLYPQGFKQWSLSWHFKIWLIAKGEATYEEVFVSKPPHIRKLLQEEGTERGRNLYGENVWCDATETWIKHLAEIWGERRFVIADIRFPNEVELVHRMGGKVVRIDAPDRAQANKLSAAARAHPSETALDNYTDFDGVLYNAKLPTAAQYPLESQLRTLFASWEWDWEPHGI